MAFGSRRSIGRGLVSALLALTLSVPLAATASAATPTFPDVPKGSKFSAQITWLAAEGITTGYADGTFRPQSTVSRGEFAIFLYRLAGSPTVASNQSPSPFTDVKKTDWLYDPIAWAKRENITTGYSDGTFRPRDPVAREEIAAFLYRFKGKPNVNLPGYSPFRDLTTKSKFFKEIMWLYMAGVTTGYSDNTFRPNNATTRAEIAAFLYRADGHPLDAPRLTAPKSFTVKGAGYGHGVGMSQYGAYGMAKEGSSAAQILQHYYRGTSVKTGNADMDIKVEVFGSGADSRNSVVFNVRSLGDDATDDGQWCMKFYNTAGKTANATLCGYNNEDLLVERNGNSVKVTRETARAKKAGTARTATATNRVELIWEATTEYQSASREDVYVDMYTAGGARATHGKYRHGKLIVNVPSTSYPRLIVANQLALNTEYLYGIAEMPSSWGLATNGGAKALQAQAIAARGFALNAVKTYSATCNCNLYDDTRSQNFTGWNKENEGTSSSKAYYGKVWVAAVNATNSSAGSKGKVLMYGNSIAKTYYFSSSGGQTENSEDIWVSQPGYLKSVDDHWSLAATNPNDSWTYTLTQAKARSIFGLDNVASIRVSSRTAGGSDAAAKVVTATSLTGKTASISGPESIRSKIVAGKSPWLWSFKANY